MGRWARATTTTIELIASELRAGGSENKDASSRGIVSELRRKMGETYSKIKSVFTNPSLSLKWKVNVYLATIISQVEYSLHFTEFSPAEIKSLDAVFHSHLRTIVGIPHPWVSIQAGFRPTNK